MSHHGCPERLSNRSKGFEDGPSQSTMEVLVETLTGTAFEMTVSPSDTVFAIKSKICRVEGIPVAQQHLLYNLRELEDGMSLSAHGVRGGAKLRLVLGLRGGPVAVRRQHHQPHWGPLERLLDNRDDPEWSGASSGGSSACRVTVLVFRDGERVNMVRVRQNTDGSYSPVDHHKYSSLPQLPSATDADGDLDQLGGRGDGEGEGDGALTANARTQYKMAEIRRRMDLSGRHKRSRHAGDTSDIQKTRSEEVLSERSLDESPPYSRYECVTRDSRGVKGVNGVTRGVKGVSCDAFCDDDDGFTPLYATTYTRYGLACDFADRYTLLPPIGTRTDSEQSVHEALEAERLELELSRSSVECSLTLPAADGRPPMAAECVPLMMGESLWPPPVHPHSQSASSLSLSRAGPGPGAGAGLPTPGPAARRAAPQLQDAIFSSSTSDLEQLRRNRLLPALSRHRNTEHLHLSDDRLDSSQEEARVLQFGDYEVTDGVLSVADGVLLAGVTALGNDTGEGAGGQGGDKAGGTLDEDKTQDAPKEVKKRARCTFCRKRLSIATAHRCRCGEQFCAPHRYAEVHGCAYDYKAGAQQYLHRANPLVAAPKLPKI